jgi:hypothetical protein
MVEILGYVRELLIISEKASTTPEFEKNTEKFFCLRFSITPQAHYPIFKL